MEFVNQGRSEEHKRLIDTILEESAQFSDCLIGIADVLNTHFSIIDYFLENGEAFKPFSNFENGKIRFLAQYFQKNIRPLDKRDYKITYSELHKILTGYSFCLNNPVGNSIDIVRIEKRSSGCLG